MDTVIDMKSSKTLTDTELRASPVEVNLDSASLSALEDITINNSSGINAVNIQDGGNSITVDSTNLDIRDLSFSTDKVDVSGSTVDTGLTPLTDTELRASTLHVTVDNPTSSVNISNFPATQNVAVTSSVEVEVKNDTGNAIPISGTVTSNIGTTNGLALDTSLSTLNTSINTLLKPANTLTKVTTIDTITNVVHVDDNSSSLTVDGTIAATQSGTWNVGVTGSLSLPTGASTLTEQQTQTTKLTSIDSKDFATQTTLNSLNTKVPSNLTVTSTRLLVDNSGVTQPISGTVTSNIGTTNGLALDTSLSTLNTSVNTLLKPASTLTKVSTVDTITNPITIQDGGGSITVDGVITANPQKGTTSTLTNVAASVTNVTLIAANSNRIQVTIFNDGDKDMYIKLGTTASTSSFSYFLLRKEHLIIDDYTGRIDAIWTGTSATARITEITP